MPKRLALILAFDAMLVGFYLGVYAHKLLLIDFPLF